jgi:hypothetical protein
VVEEESLARDMHAARICSVRIRRVVRLRSVKRSALGMQRERRTEERREMAGLGPRRPFEQ